MYHTIHEPIVMAGVYEHGHFKPVKFRWNTQTIVINEICSAHDFKDGSIHKRRFSVSAKSNIYLLEFDRYRETWFLEQIWVAN